MIGNFKLAERELSYKQAQIKMDKLYHNIEDKLLIDPSNCTIEDVRDIIKEYVIIYEHLEFPIPEFIRKNFQKNSKTSHTSPSLYVDLTLFDKKNKENYMNYMNYANTMNNTMLYDTYPNTNSRSDMMNTMYTIYPNSKLNNNEFQV